MKCERCQKNEATVHLSSTVNGQTTEHHLCDQCANELGVDMNINSYFGNIGNLFGSGLVGGGNIFNTTGGIPAFGQAAEQNIVCKSCGQSFNEFRRTGLFGCSHCYESFADRLDPVMRRVQGSTQHVGRKICQSADQQEQNLLRARQSELRVELQKAVEAEAYETAARLRDEIRVLENRICSMGEMPEDKPDLDKDKPEGGEDQ